MHSPNKKRPIVTVMGDFRELNQTPETRPTLAPTAPAAPIVQAPDRKPTSPEPKPMANAESQQPPKTNEKNVMRALIKKRVNVFSFQGDSAKPAFENVQVRYIDKYTIGISQDDDGPITVLFKHALFAMEPIAETRG